MICQLVDGAVWQDHRLICTGDVVAGELAGYMAVAIIVLSIGWGVRYARTVLRLASVALAMLSAGLLGLAAGLPEVEPIANNATRGHVVAVLDTSESVQRSGADRLDAARRALADRVLQLAKESNGDWRGTLILFGSAVRSASSDVSLHELANGILSTDLGNATSESDVEAALDEALVKISRERGSGMVLLLSDGLQTRGNIADAAEIAGQRGVPVHVLPFGSVRPTMGLLSVDLGPEQVIGRPAVVRATILGGGRLSWTVNDGAEGSHIVTETELPVPVRMPVRFAERGINFAQLGYATGDHAVVAETLFTLVRGPARVLVYGRAPWIEQVDIERFLIDRASPVDSVDPARYDVVVVDGVGPSEFSPEVPQSLLEAAIGGTGLFIVNGAQRGSIEDSQLIADWEETVVGPILPVSSDSAQYVAEPPKRDVLIVIDTSGSMVGERMATARIAAKKVLESLRPLDSVTILPFSSSAERPLIVQHAIATKLLEARTFIERLAAGGGTNIGAAIQAARELRGNNCAMFVIGDGDYPADQIRSRPICHTTAIGVAGQRLPGIDTEWGEQVVLPPGGRLGNVSYSVFSPDIRTVFWQDGPLQVMPVEVSSQFAMLTSVDGIALSYPRPEAADMSILVDPPRAPVLAFRDDPRQVAVRTGVFLGSLPHDLPAGPEGVATLMLSRILGWRDPDRFSVDLAQRGDLLEAEVTALGSRPPPERIDASITMPDGSTVPLALRASGQAGVFVGQGRVYLPHAVSRGILNLIPSGEESQSIPLRLPARSTRSIDSGTSLGAEATGFGVDYEVLGEVRERTGGVDLTNTQPELARSAAVIARVPYWPWLAAVAGVLFALSLVMGKVRR